MKILLVNNESKHIEKIQNLFPDDTVSIVDAKDLDVEKATMFDVVILSGSHINAVVGKEKETYSKQKDLLDLSSKPVIGLCAGAQLIASHYGSHLKRLDEKVRGITDIKKAQNHPLFPENKDLYRVHEGHRWVIDTLSSELQGLASSDSGWEIISHTEKPFYGIQFHPEVFDEDNDGHILFERLINFLKTHDKNIR